jgi:hypothetical protein
MNQLYAFRKMAVSLFVFALAHYSAIAQTSPCGTLAQDFNYTGASMANFSSSTVNSTAPGFTHFSSTSGPNTTGYLQRCNVTVGGTVYELVTPTYQTLNNQTAVGYGFDLTGAIKVSRVVVLLQYIAPDGTVTTVEVANFTPTYPNPSSNAVATECRSIAMSSYPGFNPGDRYRFVFQFTTASAGSASDCVIFDNFRTTGNTAAAALPVTFTGFGAKKTDSGIELVWNVAGERDVQAYEVEKSTNARDFNKIGEVDASNATAYSFIDNEPVNGLVFYRIKEVDIDGKFRYSTIARLTLNRNTQLRAYPSPARDLVTIEHDIAFNGTLSINTTDGRLVKRISVKPDLNQTVINISDLKSGLYIVRFINDNGHAESIKLLKQ